MNKWLFLLTVLVCSIVVANHLPAQERNMLSRDFLELALPGQGMENDTKGSGFKQVRIVYLVPSDSTENPEFTYSLWNAAKHLQLWYRNQIGDNLSFNLHDPVVEVYQTSHEALWYSTNPNGGEFTTFWNNVLNDGFRLTGGKLNDPDNVWMFYIDAFNACGQCGGCGGFGCVVISANDLRGLIGLPWIPICPGEGREYTPCRYVGGMGHELGHAFGLPHPPGCEDSQPWCDKNSIMWYGYTSYPNSYFSENEKGILRNSSFISEVDIADCAFSCVDLSKVYYHSDTVCLSICIGDSVLIGGIYRSVAGNYCDSLLTMNGCDSVIVTELSVNQTYAFQRELAICDGDSILIHGHYRSSAGTYCDSLHTMNGCDSLIISGLAINAKPIIDLGNDKVLNTLDTLYLDAGGDMLAYNWSNGSTERVIWLTYPYDGEYMVWVKVIDRKGCVNSDTISVHVTQPPSTSFPVSLEDIVFRVFPNPVTQILNIEMHMPGDYFYYLYSCEGILILKGAIRGTSTQIKLSDLKKGFYFITIRSKDFITTRKIIKY